MKVLVPLDGSKFAEAVLPAVAKLAQGGQMEVALVTVLKPERFATLWVGRPYGLDDLGGAFDISGHRVLPGPPGRGLQVETATQAVTRTRTEALDYLESTCHRLFPGCSRAVVLTGRHVGAELLRYASEYQVDLIAMATHGRTGLAGQLMGSVSAQVLRSGVKPVLLVRPDRLKD